MALALAFIMIVSLTAVPQQAFAAAKAEKSKVKYKVTVYNINSNTVLRKGQKLKISYTATKTKGGVTAGTKVKFKSSNKKVATVSKNGVIKAKKKGTVKITIYCKSKTSKKKTVKIRVGTPVSSISISGTRYLRVGRSSTLKASVNSGATNKNVSWWSDNPAVAMVDSNGKIKGQANGICTVYATAKDGSGVSGSRTVYVHQYYANEAKWIAHRGLHTSVKENTAAAFTAAGQSGGFWGCECDIWETRHVPQSAEALPEKPEGYGSGDNTQPDETQNDGQVADGQEPDTQDTDTGQEGDDQGAEPNDPQEGDTGSETTGRSEVDPKVMTVVDSIKALGLNGNETMLQAVKIKDGIASAKKAYNELDATQRYQVRLALQDGGNEGLKQLFDAETKITEYDSIDLAINHNSTFAEIWGNGNAVRNMSRDEIKNQLPGVCFLAEYLDICKAYNMVPVIEFKDPYMSEEAINKALDMVADRGLLDDAYYISFYSGVLANVRSQADAKLGHSSITYYLIKDNWSANVDIAKQYGFTGVSFSKALIDSNLYNRAKSYGLGVGTWTYKNQISDDEKLYKHMFSFGWQLDFVTVDYRLFQ